MRYVGYVRISSEDQRGNYSLDAQKRAITEWVNKQTGDLRGKLVHFYADEAFSGTTDDRPGFQEMVHDGRQAKFDAIVVHKFDRMARNRRDATIYKALFRTDLKIKVFSVTELSEDEDGLAGMLIEGVMELVAEWYSRNLSQETRKGKRERALQGKQNNPPPFGYDQAPDGNLLCNEHEAEGIRLAFEAFATGKYYDLDIARLLNAKGYRTKQGKVFSREIVRFILQSRTYLGLIKYQVYRKNANGSRDKKAPIEWIPGNHEALISEELFKQCQEVRARRNHAGHPVGPNRVYPLSGLIYCGYCDRPIYGQFSTGRRYYRCRSHEWSIECMQKNPQAGVVEEKLGQLLLELELPSEWQARALEAVDELLNQKKLKERIAEIREISERLDMRWDMGFLNKEEYLDKRTKLQAELQMLQPYPRQMLEEALKLFRDFRQIWESGDLYQRKHLLGLIVEKVWVKHTEITALTLRPSYHLVVSGLKKAMEDQIAADEKAVGKSSDGEAHNSSGDNTPSNNSRPFGERNPSNESDPPNENNTSGEHAALVKRDAMNENDSSDDARNEVSGAENKITTYQLDRWLYGSDGFRTRGLGLDRAAC